MRVVNLTAHTIRVIAEHRRAIASFAPAGPVARLREVQRDLPPVVTLEVSMPMTQVTYQQPEGLPPPAEGSIYLVSRVLAAAVGRDDVVFPVVAVLDADGQIVGCTSLGTFPNPDDRDA